MSVHLLKNLFRWPVLFKGMPKAADAALIEKYSAKTVKAQKGLETEGIIEDFFLLEDPSN